MDTLELQAQDSTISNGTVEASISSPPASPPPALAPVPSDLSRAAEQGKDGRQIAVTSNWLREHSFMDHSVAGTTPHTVASGTTTHPKKFSTVKIDKRFMGQNSPTPGASQVPSSSASSKIATTTGTFYAVRVLDRVKPQQ